MTISRGYLVEAVSGLPNQPTPQYVIRMAAQAFGVTINDMVSKDRSHPLVTYRLVAMAAMKEVSGLSYVKTARAFNRTDHTTARSAVERCAADDRLRDAVSSLVYEIRRQWATDNGLPPPTYPGQGTLLDARERVS